MTYLKLVLVFGLLTATAADARAQARELTGVVRDQSGLPLPGATVSVRGPAGGVLATTRSRADGKWTVGPVPEGAIRVTVQLPGFRTETRELAGLADGTAIEITLLVGGYTSELTVTASREAQTLASVPASVGVVSGSVLDAAPGVNLVESLKFVPGVAAGDVSGVDDLRISIRGAGVRAGFGSRGVVLMADGFPVTEPDGQTPHFDSQIDLASAARIEVVKGPSSALYGGAALGGVVNVITRPPARSPTLAVRAEGGSYSFAKAHLAGSGGAGPLVLGGTFGYTRLDGFRDHNSLRSWVGTARADWTADGSRLVTTLLAADARLELPGTLDRAGLEADPSQVRPVFVINDWGRENTIVRFGARYERQFGNGQGIEVSSFGQVRDLFHPIFVVIDQDARRYVGQGRYRLTRGRHALTAGADIDVQWVDDRWFVNAGGLPGFQIRDDDNTVTNAGIYLQDAIAAGWATLTLGLRADRIRYDLVDVRPADGDSTDGRSFTRVSPKLGASVRIAGDAVAYGNVSTGFEAPTLGEVRLADGFNALVAPQKAVSIEGGLRGELLRAVSFDASLYRMVVNDEILPETVDNVTVYRNVAEATHTGLELSLRIRPRRDLSLDGSYAYSRFILEEFGAFSGNRLPGIPAHMGTVRASYQARRGWDAAAALVFAGEAYVNDANTEAADGYAVLSATVGYRLRGIRLFARGENLGNVRYTNRVQVNDSAGFYYYPSPGRHVTAGVEARW